MFKQIKDAFLSALLLSPTLGIAAESAAIQKLDSPFGLPSSVASESSVVGSLPYSTQWVSEKIGSYLYASYNSAQLANQNLTVNQYVSDFGSASYSFPGVDFFSRIRGFASPESYSWARDLSIWGRYSLGFASRTGHVTSNQTPINSAVASDSLLVLNARVGLLIGFDRLSWLRPYAGFDVSPYFYRNTSDISGVEQQGENLCFGTILGAHFPVLFNGRGSLMAEFRREIAASGSGQIFANSDNYTAGMGLTF